MNRSALMILGITLAALLSVQTALAETISGSVRTVMHDKPVIGATVKVSDAAGERIATVATDSSGEYLIAGIRPGIYRIEIFSPVRGQKIVDEHVPVEYGRKNQMDFAVGPRPSMWGQAINKYDVM